MPGAPQRIDSLKLVVPSHLALAPIPRVLLEKHTNA
jgi:hypothetical protein